MRLFLIGLGSMRSEQIEVARSLKKKHDILYWVRMREHFKINEGEFPNTVFHEYRDALKCVPARGININDFEPWSSEDIASYSETESEFMSMADKLYPDWPVNERKELYYGMLRYWGGVLSRFAADCVVIVGVPHEMYNFVLYAIARRRNIRTIILDTILGDTRYFAVEDYKEGNKLLASGDWMKNETSLDDLSPDIREMYLSVSGSENPSPHLMREFWRTHTLAHNIRRTLRVSLKFLKDGTFFKRAAMKIIKSIKPSMLDECRFYEKSPDFKKPYVYFPLQYQPESTTSPLGGIYVDQLQAVRTIAAALPTGWELYVKEHPAQIGVHGGNATPARYPGFYKSIAELPNTRLVPIDTNTFRLCDAAKTTATMTGTAAWESVLRGKCALVFGYPWFMHAPGILRVGGVADCKNAIVRIQSGFVPQKDATLKYLSAVDDISARGYIILKMPGQEYGWKDTYRMIEDTLASKSVIV